MNKWNSLNIKIENILQRFSFISFLFKPPIAHYIFFSLYIFICLSHSTDTVLLFHSLSQILRKGEEKGQSEVKRPHLKKIY